MKNALGEKLAEGVGGVRAARGVGVAVKGGGRGLRRR
jgi:hypothetical protein